MLSRGPSIALSVLTGVILELGVAAVSGRREAWDSGVFWVAGLPAALVAAGAIGYLGGRRNWFWTVLIVPSQVLTMMLRSGEVGSLWPLALVLSSILSTPFVLAAFIASRFSAHPEQAASR